MALAHRFFVIASALSLGLMSACDPKDADDEGLEVVDSGDPEDPSDPDDSSDPEDSSDPSDPSDPDKTSEEELERCTERGASRTCENEEGDSGIQFCHQAGQDDVWGPCVVNPHCLPGDTSDCGACLDGEDDEWCGIEDTCVLHEGVPAWGCEVASDFEDCACNTPLVLSFDGAPVEMLASPAATFDIDGIGACITTDWPTAVTPWLALDVDKDGVIDSGRELFGSGTRLENGRRARNGFLALAALDSDGNGRIDANDERFDELVLWYDHDGDKRGTFSELESLRMRSIVAIDLGYHVDRVCDERNNCGVERSTFVYVDAHGNLARGEVVDIHLACQ